jgi:hypothetical protein
MKQVAGETREGQLEHEAEVPQVQLVSKEDTADRVPAGRLDDWTVDP